jgi:hypothetical protein
MAIKIKIKMAKRKKKNRKKYFKIHKQKDKKK